MNADLVASFLLMLVGMGTVFLFLMLVVWVVGVLSTILGKYSHLVEEEKGSGHGKPPHPLGHHDVADHKDTEIAAAIAVALQIPPRSIK